MMKSKRALCLILTMILCAVTAAVFVGCDGRETYFPNADTNNFLSRSTAEFEEINGKTVTVDLFKRGADEALNNPNVGEGLLIGQCIKYKQAHADEDVEITITSFHFSVIAAVCYDRKSKYFGTMKSLYDRDYDDSYVRIAYLLVYAAKSGINVTAIGQIDASPVQYRKGKNRDDIHFDEYFKSHLADAAFAEGKTVADFMTFRKANWTSYGDKSASDMMHVKSCTVSHYRDKDGVDHGAGVWLSSTNLDGIDYRGSNGNNGVQTGVIISDHEEIRNVVANYAKLMSNYCGQEDIGIFRDLIVRMNTAQVDLINEGRGEEIPKEERIVYLGTENDSVFEMYFTPFGGSPNTWDVVHNPYVKYIAKLLPATSGAGYITLAWNNVKYLTNFEFSNILTQVIKTAFENNARLTNKLYLKLPGIDVSAFDDLVIGENIGVKHINDNNVYFHSKDLQLSYLENYERQYVTMFTSLNFHQGAMSYQSNTVLVIKETKKTGNDVYVNFGKEVTFGVISENDRIAKTL